MNNSGPKIEPLGTVTISDQLLADQFIEVFGNCLETLLKEIGFKFSY